LRPLAKPPLPAAAIALHAPHGLLMNAHGHFCAFCERPLLAEAWVWDAATGQIVEEKPDAALQWEYLYLLCHNCYAAQARLPLADLSALLLPDDPTAFRPLSAESQLRYSLERLTRVFTDEAGNETGAPETIEQVVVVGNTAAARATIAHFSLNTAYYRSEEKMLVIPRQDYLSHADRRMEQRTLAWRRAEQVARVHAKAGRAEIADAVIEQLRLLVGAMGYWSSCLTAALGVIEDRALLRRVFQAPATEAMPHENLAIAGMAVEEAVAFRGCGPHHTFPGTRDIFA
jgi:hypothetical protein